MSAWEPFDAPRRMWVVVDVEEPYSCTPRAILRSEREANEWIEWARADGKARPDESWHINAEYYVALPVRELAGEFWNSCEPCEVVA